MAKKKLNKTQRKEQRLWKARQWLTTYNGTPKKYLSITEIEDNCYLEN